MSLNTMAKSLALEIPGVSEILARTKIQEAMGKIYDETAWSFQTKQSGWLVPGLKASTGTVTVTPYSASVVGDATAAAIWNGFTGRPLITELQFRDPSYALYDIIDYDGVNTITLDRPWMEPTSGPGRPYYMYQAYFPVPLADFRSFTEMRDTTNGDFISWTKLSQDDLSVEDPQRVVFGPALPTYAVPLGVDSRPNSSTLGYLRYEVWPHILSQWPIAFSYKRRGPELTLPGDTVSYPITEELVMWRAKEVLYQFKEAQKGEEVQRGSGADWRFLAEAAAEEYKEVLKKIRAVDCNLHRDFVSRKKTRSEASNDGFSTTRTGMLNIGRF